MDRSAVDEESEIVSNDSRLWAVVVTFRRPEGLKSMLQALGGQTKRPDRLVIVDCGSEASVMEIARNVDAEYIDALENLGPAGGVALGMEHVLEHAASEDWLLLLDDDDPPRTPEMVERLWDFAVQCRATDPRTAGVGVVGARYNPRRGTQMRLADEDLHGPVPVDTIGGGHLPIYSVSAIRDVGVFDARLFFGSEEAEFGLRLKRAGYQIYAEGDLWARERAYRGRMRLPRSALRTPTSTSAWRRYYTTRNTTTVARRYGRWYTAPGVAAVAGARGALALLRSGRPLREVLLPVRGAIDGLRGHLGRTVDPGRAEKLSD